MKSKEITDNAILVAVSIIMGIIPVLNLFQIIPLIILSLKYEKRSIWGLMIASLILGLLNGGAVMILASFVTVGLFSYMYGILLKKGLNSQLFIGGASLIALLITVFSYILSQLLFNVNPLHSMANIFLDSLKTAYNFYGNSPNAAAMKEQYEAMRIIITKALPGMLFSAIVYYVLIIYYVLRFFMKKIGQEIFTELHFSRIRFPIVLPLFMGVIFILDKMYSNAFLDSYLINIAYFIYGVAFLEGLSVLKYYLNKYKLSVWFGVLAFFVPYIFMFVGFTDIFIDLRRGQSNEGSTT